MNSVAKSIDADDYEFASKKRKFDHMVDGSIVNLVLKNFMIFTEVKYTAHTKLNMIIGPNGSGKSSIVTALILGFGGSPKDINRGDRVSQFVKLGKHIADISIELYKKSTQNIKLKRTIFASNETCQYYINDVMVSKKKYVEMVESLNIKVHNLCQFLPQDRLEDFSKLDSKGLLISALQSIENQELLENFEKLKDLANSMSTFDSDKKKLQNIIRLESSANLRLETIVSTFSEKKSLENEILIVLQKRSWSLYILAWKQIKSEIKKFEDVKKYNKNALTIVNQHRAMIEKKKKRDHDFKNVVLENLITANTLLDKIHNKVDIAESCVSDMKALNATVKETRIKIEDLRESASLIKEKLENIKNETFNVEECKQEVIEINKKISIIDENINPIKKSLENVKNRLKGVTGKIYAIDQELDRENRKQDAKNQFLQRKYPEMWKAVLWLRNCDKTSLFKGQVFEPLFTQIEVLDQKNSKYIENIINYRDMIAFVFEYAEDLTTFNKIVKQERWQKINSISAPPANLKFNDTPNYDINNLRKFGFHSYALDLIKTPSVIKRYLSRNYDMHNIPIGSRQVINNLQHLPDNIGVFFAGNDQIIIRTSMYTGEKITRQTQISNEAQFLIYSVDSNLIQSLTMKKEEAKVECEQFEQQLAEFMNKLKISEESRQPYFLRKKEIQGSILKFENKKNGYDRVLSDLQFTQSDLEREEKKSSTFLNQTTQIIEKYFGVMKEVVSLLDHYASSTKSVVASAFFVKHCCIDLYEENKILNQLKTLYMCNMKNFNDYQNYIQNMESEFKKMQEVALYWTRGVSPYDKNLFKPINENFEKIEQSDIEDLDSLIIEKKAKLNCLNIDSNAPQLVKEYKERKTKLKDLEKKLENLNNDAQSKEDQIEKLYTKWFPKLKELTGLLNKNFQKFITSFGCSGIIELDTGITTNDFQAYGLLIKVQFRNDYPSLRLLDSKSQSGGERALITALFLLALQEVTHFPFRIVDEINQGMDKVNERKLMELFMELFENRNDQYLVVTPKLIKNLSFKNTTVDIIISILDEEK